MAANQPNPAAPAGDLFEPAAIDSGSRRGGRGPRYPRQDSCVSDVISVEQQIESTLIAERLLTSLATGFAVLVLVLVSTGLPGLVSYSVARRSSEFGIRIAIGAPRQRVEEVGVDRDWHAGGSRALLRAGWVSWVLGFLGLLG